MTSFWARLMPRNLYQALQVIRHKKAQFIRPRCLENTPYLSLHFLSESCSPRSALLSRTCSSRRIATGKASGSFVLVRVWTVLPDTASTKQQLLWRLQRLVELRSTSSIESSFFIAWSRLVVPGRARETRAIREYANSAPPLIEASEICNSTEDAVQRLRV